MHSNAESRAREFLDQIMREYSQSLPRDILMVNVTPVIGTHVGPERAGICRGDGLTHDLRSAEELRDLGGRLMPA